MTVNLNCVTVNPFGPTILKVSVPTNIVQKINDFADTQEDKETRCIIITGAGEKAFVAGADISEFSEFNVDQGENLARRERDIERRENEVEEEERD